MRMAFQPSGVSILSPRMEKASRISPAEAGSPTCPDLNSASNGRARDGKQSGPRQEATPVSDVR